MAAPASKTVHDMTGVWQINRKLTGDTNPLFILQGISWITRKIINYATVTLSMKSSTLPIEDNKPHTTPTLSVTQNVSPGNFNSEHMYILDSVPREAVSPIFGKMEVSSQFVGVGEIEDEGLRKMFEGKEERLLMLENAMSLANGWKMTAVWGFEEVEGERRYVRYTVTRKGEKEIRLRLVYDFVREL